MKSARAQEAVAALHKLHSIKKRGPMASSLFLDQILAGSGLYSGECFVGDRLYSPNNWSAFVKKNTTDDKIKANIKLSSVNINYDANVWDWDLITALFKFPGIVENRKYLFLEKFGNVFQNFSDIKSYFS
jgi:rapamycin-insensitive companion of mTOR